MVTKSAKDTRTAILLVAAQIGCSEMLPDNDQWINRFQAKSTSSSSLYTIAQRRSDKTWGCSCVGWRNHRKCKHLTDVLKRLSNVNVASVTDEAVRGMLASAKSTFLDLSGPKEVALPTLKGRDLDLF